MSLSTNFLDIPSSISSYDSAKVAVLPIPYEATTTYGKGTVRGPEAIISASSQLECFDEEIKGEACQVGIATLDPVDFSGEVGQEAIEKIKKRASEVIGDGKFLVGLGGEHTVTLGLVGGILEHSSDFGVLQIDAHADLRESYEGDPYSHASVMRRIHDLGVTTIGVGIRSLCTEEMDYIGQAKVPVYFDRIIHENGFPLKDVLKNLPDKVYITIDVDGFAPSLVPATGTPEPGGLPWYETLSFLKSIFKEKSVLGFDVVELLPRPGFEYVDFAMAKLINKLIGYRFCI
ncbi:agmatinase [Bdellovibrionota bacterium]